MSASSGSATPRLPLWAGRMIVLLGIVLVSSNLRTAATSLSPIVGEVSRDIPLGAAGLGVLGMLPPLTFAAAGIFAPRLARRLGLEASIVVAIVAMIAGFSARAVASEYWGLFAGTLLALAAAGAGNILLPPIVKRYFPDRIGLITSLYATAVAVGIALPPIVAYPIAASAHWRMSLAVWAMLAIVSLPPWIAVLVQRRRSLRAALDTAPELEEPEPALLGRIWHSRVAWAITMVFALTSFQAYALFAWLPQLLVDQVGVSALEAGLLLGAWGLLGMVASFIAPILVARLSNVGWVMHVGAAGFFFGYLGLLLAPGVSPWLWIALCGVGQIIFPACLALINLRTKTHEGSIALSGFAQAIGYLIAALGPLLVGLLHDITGGWVASLSLMCGAAVLFVYFGVVLRTPRFVEDELAARPTPAP
ncbi:MAG: MFS transporter [Terrimesophilobacter sp.]